MWHTIIKLKRKTAALARSKWTTECDVRLNVQNNRRNGKNLLLPSELCSIINLLPPGEVAVFPLTHKLIIRRSFAVMERDKSELKIVW